MSAVIKSVDAQGCRPLGHDPEIRDQSLLDVVQEREHQIADLREKISELQTEKEAKTAEARRNGIAEGRKLAIEDFEYSRSEALDRLEVSCNKALEYFSSKILDVENLSILIARTVLDQLLLGQERYVELAREVIAERIKEIDRSSIVRILVSQIDFPEQSELDQLADLCAIDQAVIEQRDDLHSGQCRIELMLGVLDVGLRQQWERMNDELNAALSSGVKI